MTWMFKEFYATHLCHSLFQICIHFFVLLKTHMMMIKNKADLGHH